MAGPKRTGAFVVAYGEEEFLLDRVVAAERSRKDRQVIYLDGDGLLDHEIVSYCEQGSLDGRVRVVIVDNANKVKGDKALTTYVDGKSATDDQTVLVAIVRSDKLAKVWQQAAAKGRLDHHKKLKPWETAALKDRVTTEATKLMLTLDADALEVLVVFFGDNLRRVHNELQKLSFIATAGRVTKKDVILVSAPDAHVDPFDVGKVATDKDPKRALRMISALFKIQGDSAAIPITAGLLSQVEKLIVTRQMLDHGMEAKSIADALGIPPYPVQKDIIPRALKHTVPALLDQMQRLCRLDAQIKGAARSKRTLVELAVLSIAA